ncbi:hypothetical protein D9M73_198330 [compost metagenome]
MPGSGAIVLKANVEGSLVHHDGRRGLGIESIDTLEFPGRCFGCYPFQQFVGLPVLGYARPLDFRSYPGKLLELRCRTLGLSSHWRPTHRLHAIFNQCLFQFSQVIHCHGVIGRPKRSIQVDPATGCHSDHSVGHSVLGIAIDHQQAASVALKGEHPRFR